MPNSRDHDHLLSSHFKVEISGITQGAFSAVSGLECVTDVIEYVNGDDYSVRKRPGRSRFSNIVLTKGALTSHELWEWYTAVMDGKIERRGGSVIVLGDDMTEKYRYNFFEAWPCRWKGMQMDATAQITLVEELELVVEKIELA